VAEQHRLRGHIEFECKRVAYATDGAAVAEVFGREAASVAYRCDGCGQCHVVGGRDMVALNVPRLMAEGRFIAG
jgi:cytochrome c553